MQHRFKSAVMIVAAGLAGSPAPVSARDMIVIRHDRSDQRYLDLGAGFPSVARVGRRMGDGTLIGNKWVLTAGHVAVGLMTRGQEPTVFFGERSYKVVNAFVHPAWVDMNPHDIAVLELAEPVEGVAPVALFRASNERGLIATLVGHGRTGTGDRPERHDDDQKRGATNRIDRATAAQLVFRFDAPPSGTDLEGIPGAGDSGGPAFLSIAGELRIAGVSSAGQPGKNGPGSYGALDYFTRVSTHAAWIDRVMAGKERPRDFARSMRTDASPALERGASSADALIPDSPAGRQLRALTKILFAGDTASIDGFVSRSVTLTGSLSEAQARYRRLMQEFVGARVTGVLLLEPLHVDVIVRTATGERILGVVVESTGAQKIVNVFTGRP